MDFVLKRNLSRTPVQRTSKQGDKKQTKDTAEAGEKTQYLTTLREMKKKKVSLLSGTEELEVSTERMTRPRYAWSWRCQS